jgi:FAD synthase
MSAPFFCVHRMGCSPHELDELLIELAAEQQRMEIQAALAKRHLELAREKFSQDGASAARVVHTHEVGGSIPSPATNPNDNESQPYPKGRWT